MNPLIPTVMGVLMAVCIARLALPSDVMEEARGIGYAARRVETTPDETVLMECYNQKTNTTKMVPSIEFWKNPACMLDLTSKVLFLHIGKAGGGSVHTVRERYRVHISKCHPDPTQCGLRKRLNKTQHVLVPIRDPVDRFVSAFNWRSLVLCSPEDMDHRTRTTSNTSQLAVHDPVHYCKTGSPEEAEILHSAYNYDVNELAEALCDEKGPKGARAREHASMIQHSKSTLRLWLQEFLGAGPTKHDNIQDFVAVVMESKDYGFEDTIANAMEHLIRQEYPGLKEFPANITTMTGLAKEKNAHSSKSNSLPAGLQKKQLSPLGECCLARHLAKDYQLIKAIANGQSSGRMDPRLAQACQWGSKEDTRRCLEQLRSMVQRRESFLGLGEGNAYGQTCRDLTGS